MHCIVLHSAQKFLEIANTFLQIVEMCVIEPCTQYRSQFVMDPQVTAARWEYIERSSHTPTDPKHLLLSFNFLEMYSNESILSATWRCNKKTFWKWDWFILTELSKIYAVRYFFLIFLIFLLCSFYNFSSHLPLFTQFRWTNRLVNQNPVIENSFAFANGTGCPFNYPSCFNRGRTHMILMVLVSVTKLPFVINEEILLGSWTPPMSYTSSHFNFQI